MKMEIEKYKCKMVVFRVVSVVGGMDDDPEPPNFQGSFCIYLLILLQGKKRLILSRCRQQENRRNEIRVTIGGEDKEVTTMNSK